MGFIVRDSSDQKAKKSNRGTYGEGEIIRTTQIIQQKNCQS
jgi:hypothetical protein